MVTEEALKDWDQFGFSYDEEPKLILAEPAVPQPDVIIPGTNNVSIDSGPQQSKKYITTQLNSAVKAANKIKEK